MCNEAKINYVGEIKTNNLSTLKKSFISLVFFLSCVFNIISEGHFNIIKVRSFEILTHNVTPSYHIIKIILAVGRMTNILAGSVTHFNLCNLLI